MKLEDLIAVGSINNGYQRVPVSWQKTSDENIEFDVLAKREMSCADYEYIYLGTGRRYDDDGQPLNSESDGIMARRVHRMCKWPSDDPKVLDKHIPEETARGFKTSLLAAICSSLASVEERLSSADDAKKN